MTDPAATPESLIADLPFQCTFPGRPGQGWFPPVLAPDHADSLQEQVAANAGKLLAVLEDCGAILFRGFQDNGAQGFHEVMEALPLPAFTYDESLSNAVRRNRTDRVFTANEAPPELEIFLHHEMAQTPCFPRYLFFYCEKAPETGGATPLCRSDHLLYRLEQQLPEFIDRCRRLGVTYTHTMPGAPDEGSGQGRSWRDTLAVADREQAEAKLQSLGYQWLWQGDDELRVTTPPLPAVSTTPSGEGVFFNQLVAAHAGWQHRPEYAGRMLSFGDGSAMPRPALEQLVAVAYSEVYDHAWRPGDVIVIDNLRVMHGRRPFTGSRSVLAGLAVASRHGVPGHA